ncbi:MAG: UDP-glucose--hexose-1-phosphate uridylyltransferase [Cyclobacteriaceae bacterium]
MMILKEQPHKRYNPLSDEWVLVSPHRTKRPWQGKTEDIVVADRSSYDSKCYLCPGNKRAGGEKNPTYESTFVFKNDFAALIDEGATEVISEGLLKMQEERGICKVMCFSPDHSLTIPEMEKEDLIKVIKMWKSEFDVLASNPTISSVQIFENKGAIMGCSNPHPHGQIWAQSSIPNETQKQTITQQQYFAAHNRSMLADYLEQELEEEGRIIVKNEHFVCLVPFWAVWPYESMIIPRRHFQAVTDMTDAEEDAFTDIMLDITIRYDNLFNTSFPYSAGMQQRPTDGGDYSGWHFHYSFYPPLLRSATVKKFMVGYEMFANPQRDITAEQAAAALRSLSNVHYKKQSDQTNLPNYG